MPATPAWLAAIEAVLNRSIDQSLRARESAARLDGTSFEVAIEGMPCIRASVRAGRLALASNAVADADASVSGPPFALLELFASRAGRSTAARAERLAIRGDAEIAARYRELLTLARPDWDEELSRIVGDLPARRLSIAARGALSWLRSTGRTVAGNLAEYLQEESRDLVSAAEVEEFVTEVDALRELADRVEARLRRVEARLEVAS